MILNILLFGEGTNEIAEIRLNATNDRQEVIDDQQDSRMGFPTAG